MKTMLQIVQAATAQMGIPVPTLVVGSTATDTIQLQALLNQLLDDLQRDYIWEALSTEYRFTTQSLTTTGTLTDGSAVITGIPSTVGLDATYQPVATGINNDTYVQTVDSATQVTMTQAATESGTVPIVFCKVKYSMPADFDRLTDRTQWDKSKHWEMLGPETPQQWQWLKSGYIATGPRIRWRMMGGYFQIWPAVSSPEYLGFEYISNSPVRDTNGVAKQSFTADSDTSIFPDGLLIAGLKHMYYEAKGFGDQYKPKFDELLGIAKANDGGSATLEMAPNPLNILIGWENIPDGNYGQ
jgi:hypothetical protein